MLIAATSSDGVTINQHFGHADHFRIYEVADGSVRLVRELVAEPYCTWSATVREMTPEQFAATMQQMRDCTDGAPGGAGRPHHLAAFAAALGDCRVVVTSMIGEGPREVLARAGIDVHAVPGPIAQVLPEITKLY